MNLANGARVLALALGCAAALGSATSTSNNGSSGTTNAPPTGEGAIYGNSPPPAQQMDPTRALGLWKSTFGAVKIGADPNRQGAVQGVWLYQRQGQEVIGYFNGTLNGNVLSFRWQEPGNGGPPLVGEGWVAFETSGRQYSGRWWSDKHDRVGDWNGWRQGGGPGHRRRSKPAVPGTAGWLPSTAGADPYAPQQGG